jgi:transcriptional/translational regulatory protein YebC/TACO1
VHKATDKDTANYKEVLFEGYAPHGIAILVETATMITTELWQMLELF